MKLSKENKERWTRIIKTYHDLQRLTAVDEAFVRGVLRSSEYYSKLSLDAQWFVVKSVKLGGYNKKVVHAFKTGKFIPCVFSKMEGTKTDHRTKVVQVAREIIKPQIEAFKRATSHVDFCELTKEPINGRKTHVDHVHPFIDMFVTWSANEGISLEDPRKMKLKGRVGSREFADSRLTESWSRYHQKHAKLAKVLAEANLAKGASGRTTKRYRKPKHEVIIT